MRTLDGTVVSVKMNDTAVVAVERRTPHPLYKKLQRWTSRFKVDTKGQTVKLGDMVRIIETRPMSSGKYFKIQEVKK